MGVFNTAILIIGLLALIEGIIVVIFPNWSRKVGQKMFKNKKNLRKAGFIEIIVALVLILIGMNI